MSLARVVDFLVDGSNSATTYLRAIRLFELQVAMFHPKSFGRLIANDSEAKAPNLMLRTARIFAAIKLLEMIETALRCERMVDTISIRELAEHEDYRRIFDDVITPNGGWLRIRHSMTARNFDDNIMARREEALTAAKIVDFSYRFSLFCADSGYRGGVNTARYVVRTAASYKTPVSKSTMKNRWREYQLPAAFLYLMLVQDFDLLPPRVSSSKFAETLLKQAIKADELRRFFRAYQVVRESLLLRGYQKFPTLDLDLQCPAPPLNTSAFSPDIQAAFEKSKDDNLDD